jgi:hypothetical protein
MVNLVDLTIYQSFYFRGRNVIIPKNRFKQKRFIHLKGEFKMQRGKSKCKLQIQNAKGLTLVFKRAVDKGKHFFFIINRNYHNSCKYLE